MSISWTEIIDLVRDKKLQNVIGELREDGDISVSFVECFLKTSIAHWNENMQIAIQAVKQLLASVSVNVKSKISSETSLLLLEIVSSMALDENESVPMRGTALAILGECVLTKHGNSIASMKVVDVAEKCLKGIVKSFEQNDSMQSAIILHQLAKLIELSNRLQLSNIMVPLLACIDDIACLLLQSTSMKLVQLQVDAMKIFSILAETWLHFVSASNRDLFISYLRVEERNCHVAQLPQCMLAVTVEGSLIHDNFYSVFRNAHDVVLYWLSECVAGLEFSPAVADRVQELLTVQQRIHRHITQQTAELDMVACKRVELLMSYVNEIYDSKQLKNAPPLRAKVQVPPEATIAAVTSLLESMKSAAKTMAKSDKELRGAYAELRKGAIALLSNLLSQEPAWIEAHVAEYWDLCLKVCNTPVLFVSGMKSYGATHPEFQVQVLSHLFSSLRALERYSLAAAEDILTTLQDLSEDKCLLLLKRVAHPQRQGESFSVLQRLVEVLTAGVYPKCNPASIEEEQRQWKSSVLQTLNKLVSLSKSHLHTEVASDIDIMRCLSLPAVEGLLTCLGGDILQLSKLIHDSNLSSSKKAGKRSKQGGALEGHIDLLQQVTATCTSLTDAIRMHVRHVSLLSPEGADADYLEALCVKCFAPLLHHIVQNACRNTIFQDDTVQLFMELEQMNSIALLLWTIRPANFCWTLELATVVLCNVGWGRSIASIGMLDVAPYTAALSALLSGVRDLRIAGDVLHGHVPLLASVENKAVQSVTSGGSIAVEVSSSYESARELILSLFDEVTAARSQALPSADMLIKKTYEWLPLEADQTGSAPKTVVELGTTVSKDILAVCRLILSENSL